MNSGRIGGRPNSGGLPHLRHDVRPEAFAQEEEAAG